LLTGRLLKKQPARWWGKNLKGTGDFVIPAKAGSQGFFELFDF